MAPTDKATPHLPCTSPRVITISIKIAFVKNQQTNYQLDERQSSVQLPDRQPENTWELDSQERT